MGKLKVLVVEDHPDIQDTYRMSLEHLVDVVIAGSIASAMSELRAEPNFSLIILDGNVPQHDAGPSDTTIILAEHISSLKIPMLSASGCENLNNILVSKGCMRANKFTATQEARRFLKEIAV